MYTRSMFAALHKKHNWENARSNSNGYCKKEIVGPYKHS